MQEQDTECQWVLPSSHTKIACYLDTSRYKSDLQFCNHVYIYTHYNYIGGGGGGGESGLVTTPWNNGILQNEIAHKNRIVEVNIGQLRIFRH